MDYHEPLFRPPAEADSLIFQVAYGCPHNTCKFCMMYKGVKYLLREPNEIFNEIAQSADCYPETKRVFLADGDVMALDFSLLEALMVELNRHFPRLARINIYANGSSIAAKSPDQLLRLRQLKLNTLYLGLESGSQQILDLVGKGESVRQMIDAVSSAQAASLRCSVMILLGLGGKKYSDMHAKLTAEALDLMQPRLLSALRFVVVPGCRMYNDFEELSEYECVTEMLKIVEALNLHRTVFRANHSSNPIPLAGRFPQDKNALAAELKMLLESGSLDKSSSGNLPLFL